MRDRRGQEALFNCRRIFDSVESEYFCLRGFAVGSLLLFIVVVDKFIVVFQTVYSFLKKGGM